MSNTTAAVGLRLSGNSLRILSSQSKVRRYDYVKVKQWHAWGRQSVFIDCGNNGIMNVERNRYDCDGTIKNTLEFSLDLRTGQINNGEADFTSRRLIGIGLRQPVTTGGGCVRFDAKPPYQDVLLPARWATSFEEYEAGQQSSRLCDEVAHIFNWPLREFRRPRKNDEEDNWRAVKLPSRVRPALVELAELFKKFAA